MTQPAHIHLGGWLARRAAVLLVSAVLLSLALPIAAVGYIGQPPFRVSMSGPGRIVRCDDAVRITVRVVDYKSRTPIRRQTVKWDIARAQSGGDRLSDGQTSTDARGRTSVTLTFGPAAGTRKITAKAGVVPASIEVRCAGGLPATVAVAPGGSPFQAERLAAFTSVTSPVVSDAQLGVVDAGVPATRLRIGRLGMDLAIEMGDGVRVPDSAAAHFPGTAWPGAGSNTFLYAHNRPGLFAPLWQIRTGDLVSLSLADGTLAWYRVSQIRPVVAWDDLEVLAPTPTERLTLQTCLTYDPAAPRLIVVADRVSAPA